MSAIESNILITRPIGTTVWTVILCSITIAICSLLYFAQYTQKHSVQGILVPDKGLTNVTTPDAGIVTALNVENGSYVHSGDLIYKILNSHAISETDAIRSERRNSLVSQNKSLQDDIARQIKLNSDAKNNLKKDIQNLNQKQISNKNLIKLLNEKIEISKNNLTRYETLAGKGLYSVISAQEKRMDYIDMESQKINRENENETSKRQLDTLVSTLAAEELQGESKLAALNRTLQETQDKLIQYDSSEYIYITAPSSGIVTNLSAKVGQHIEQGAVVLNIIPDGSELYAELYAPSNAIGFVNKGDEVLIRYRSFPYQKFGQDKGIISYISKASINEQNKNSPTSQSSSIYKIIVSLPNQYVMAYKNKEPLQAGMEIDAEILLDKRRLYEWLFEPIIGALGKK